MLEKDIIFYYKKTKKQTEKLCTKYAYKYKREVTDLLSFANELFILACRKYIYKKRNFEQFYMYVLHMGLTNKLRNDYFKLQRRQERFKELYLRQQEYHYSQPDLEKIEISDFVCKILDFCMKEDCHKKLELYSNNKQYKNRKISKYALVKYFKVVFGYSRKDILSGLSEINYLLQTNNI